jgi:DNA primase
MSQIQQVKEASDIVAVIGERINLQRSGRNMRGLCPFHSEKSPSFFVSPDLQVFRCFGCGERGDVLTFLQRYEGMTFSEAMEMLAEKAGIKLERYQKSAEDDTREKMLEVLELAKEYYHYLLTKHTVGQTARDYLKIVRRPMKASNFFKLVSHCLVGMD